MSAETTRFELAALYRAVDSKRLRRRLKWPDVAAEIGLRLRTVQSVRFAERMAADDVLAIVRWLGVAPETFMRPVREGPIPEYMAEGTVWRADPGVLYAALDAARMRGERRGLRSPASSVRGSRRGLVSCWSSRVTLPTSRVNNSTQTSSSPTTMSAHR